MGKTTDRQNHPLTMSFILFHQSQNILYLTKILICVAFNSFSYKPCLVSSFPSLLSCPPFYAVIQTLPGFLTSLFLLPSMLWSWEWNDKNKNENWNFNLWLFTHNSILSPGISSIVLSVLSSMRICLLGRKALTLDVEDLPEIAFCSLVVTWT